MKLLVLLGLVFFIYILQDVFNIKLAKAALDRVEEAKTELNIVKVGRTENENLLEQIKK